MTERDQQIISVMHRDQQIIDLTSELLDLITSDAGLPEVLTTLANAVQIAFPGTLCSVLLLDGAVLRHGAAPSLPQEYVRAIDGVIIGPGTGSCGTAAYTGQAVIVSDIASDPLWIDYRAAALAAGLRACWSVPIRGTLGEVLGTVAFYYDQPRRPTEDERQRMTRWVHFASIAMTRSVAIHQLHEAATRDPLTGLMNQLELNRQVAAFIQTPESDLAVLLVDIDKFRIVNATYGRHIGDRFLRAFAERLIDLCPPGDTIGRIGGDEFVILHRFDPVLGATAQHFARTITRRFLAPTIVGGHAAALSVSIGIAGLRRDGDLNLIGDPIADAALAEHAAKSVSRGSVRTFSPELGENAARQLSLERDLSQALVNGEITCVYQPTVDLRSDAITGVEVLARWESPQRGTIPPGRFIPIAEDTGLIADIGEFILVSACRQMRLWRDLHPHWRQATLWVNVSTRQLTDPRFSDLVMYTLTNTGLPPDRFGVEVTESLFIGDPPAVRETLHFLRSVGIKLAIDDFGTGYSSLSQLSTLPVDVLKIDRQFVSNLCTDPVARGLVQAILTFAATLELDVVAEGIETPQQRDQLKALGCNTGQGYLWGFPTPASTHHLPPSITGGPTQNPANFTRSGY